MFGRTQFSAVWQQGQGSAEVKKAPVLLLIAWCPGQLPACLVSQGHGILQSLREELACCCWLHFLGGGKGKPFRKRIFTIVLQQQDTLFLCLLGAAVCCPAFFFFRWANTDLLSLLLRALDCFSREGLVSCRQADVKDQHEQQKTQEEKLWSRGDWFDRSQGKSRWQREWDIC